MRSRKCSRCAQNVTVDFLSSFARWLTSLRSCPCPRLPMGSLRPTQTDDGNDVSCGNNERADTDLAIAHRNCVTERKSVDFVTKIHFRHCEAHQLKIASTSDQTALKDAEKALCMIPLWHAGFFHLACAHLRVRQRVGRGEMYVAAHLQHQATRDSVAISCTNLDNITRHLPRIFCTGKDCHLRQFKVAVYVATKSRPQAILHTFLNALIMEFACRKVGESYFESLVRFRTSIY